MTTPHTEQPKNLTKHSSKSSESDRACKCQARRTPLTLSALADVHTTDLTDSCLRRVLLRHEQKTTPIATTALFRGLLAGKVLEHVHGGANYDTIEHGIGLISVSLVRELEDEGRMLSDSVTNNLVKIQGEVLAVTEQYINRLMPLFEQCEFVGTELPCRLNLLDTKFASHLDLLVRDTNNVFGYGQGRLLCVDWKFRQDAPTKAYLSRNLQFYLYWLMIREGSIMAYPAVDGWVSYKEDPQMLWCHLPALKPFGRKTVVKNLNGEPTTYNKGDQRPVSSVLRHVNYIDDNNTIQELKNDLLMRVEMMRAGLFPKNPDPVGCQVCEAQDFCSRGDTAIIMERQ